MRTVFLVTVILCLAITAAGLKLRGVEVQFGDMIAYPPVCIGGIYLQHFAIYVGDKVFPDKQPRHNIFERLKDTDTLAPTCIFSELALEEDPFVFNFLDGYVDPTGKKFQKGTDAEITQRINELKGKCGLYNAVTNNCEHLATKVRYGQKISLQVDLTGEKLCILPTAKDMLKYVKTNTACPANPGPYSD